jgi:hypothetical protein
MAIKILLRDSQLFQKMNVDKDASTHLSKGDIIFVGRSRQIGDNKWEKIEYNGKRGYVKNPNYESVIIGKITSKGKKIYAQPDLDSNVVKTLFEGEEIAVLKTIISHKSLWLNIKSVYSGIEGYYFLSDTSFPPNDKGYRPIKNSFFCYLSFLNISKTKPLKRRIRVSHLFGLFCAILTILLILIIGSLFDFHHIGLILGFFLSSFVIFFSGLFDWLNLRFIK